MISSIDLPSRQESRDDAKRGLIYFVPGNPGVVEYYVDFLRCLRGLLDAREAGHGMPYDIHGRNLLGFKDAEHEPFGPGNEPWDLDGQIRGTYEQVASVRFDDQRGKRCCYDSVVLMGHSVGSYIAVEVFQRHLRDPSAAPHLRLRHGLLLFPTLTDLALSPSGVRATALLGVPGLGPNAHRLARLLLAVVPEPVLRGIVHRFMGFSAQTAAVTAEWLKSRDGVWQAIHLARAELRDIAEDKWEAELWEASSRPQQKQQQQQDDEEPRAPRFFLFYGKDDHWVANHIRDDFIAQRRKHGEQAVSIAVDEGNLPHAFCVREGSSLEVAQKVATWVDEIEGVDQPV